MERMFAPWRNRYVTGEATRDKGCVLCTALGQAEAPESLVVHRARHNFVIMNLYPYNSGHLMVAPHRHLASLGEATGEELGEMMLLARRLEGVLREAYRPDGLNIGMNVGKPAGAGVADHLHLHLVPRWNGDTNFMTVLGDTRVVPEDPVEACQRLRRHFA